MVSDTPIQRTDNGVLDNISRTVLHLCPSVRTHFSCPHARASAYIGYPHSFGVSSQSEVKLSLERHMDDNSVRVRHWAIIQNLLRRSAPTISYVLMYLLRYPLQLSRGSSLLPDW